MNFKTKAYCGASAFACALAISSHAAHAQDATEIDETAQVEEEGFADNTDAGTVVDQQRGFNTIVVTARKTGENEQTLPISIAAFGTEELQAQTIQNVGDIQRIAPGLSISANSQGNAPLFAIRGTATENQIDGGIAVYFGDVPVSSPIAITNAFYDIASLEILKGPQGTQFGRNTTGGTISIRPQLPTNNLEGYVQAGYGNYDRFELEGMVNLPVNDVLAFRFAGNYVKRDGFIENPANAGITPERFWTEDHYSLRGSMRIDLDGLTSDFIFDWYEQDDIGNTAIAVAFGAPAGVPALSPENFGAQLGGPGVVYIGPDISGSQREYYQRAEIFGFQNVTNIDVTDNFALRTVVGYREADLASSQNSAGYTITSINVLTVQPKDLFVADVTLRYTSDNDRLRLSLGGYLSDENQGFNVVANAVQTLLPVFAQNPAIPIEFTSNIRYTSDREISSRAIYANGDFDITDALNVFAGVRYNWDEASLFYEPYSGAGFPDVGEDFGPGPGYSCDLGQLSIYQQIDVTNCNGFSEADFEETSWNFGLNYNITPDVLTYAKVSRGYLAGGINNNLREVPIFAPETNTQYEIGLKADWFLGNMPVRTNIAGYITKIKDKQIVQNTNYDDGVSANGVLNAAEETVKGIDLEIQFSPIDALTFNVNYSYIDAQFDDFQFPALGGNGNGIIDAGDLVVDPGPPVGYATAQLPQDLTGETPARVPEHQLNIAATLDLMSDPGLGDLSLTASAYYTSDIDARNIDTTGPFPDELLILEDYWLANASLRWDNIGGSPIGATFWIKNLFDEEYAVLKDAQLFVFGYANAYFGEPRTYGVTARVEW